METYFKDKKLSRGFVAERIIETKYNTGHTLYIGPGVSVVLGHNHHYRPAPSPALSMTINRRNVEEKEIHTPAVFSVWYIQVMIAPKLPMFLALLLVLLQI